MSLTINGSGGGTPVGVPTIETGTYTGTGTYGSSNKNSITFSGTPVYVRIVGNGFVGEISQEQTYSSGYMGFVYLVTSQGSSSGRFDLTMSAQGNTLSWTGSSAVYQLNASNKTYTYFAITL